VSWNSDYEASMNGSALDVPKQVVASTAVFSQDGGRSHSLRNTDGLCGAQNPTSAYSLHGTNSNHNSTSDPSSGVTSPSRSTPPLEATTEIPSLANITTRRTVKHRIEDTIPGYMCFEEWVQPPSKRIKHLMSQRKTKREDKKEPVCLRCRIYKLGVSFDLSRFPLAAES
jgi:hypothetical protein